MEGKETTSITTQNKKRKICVSCGVELMGRKRRYCSKDCRGLLDFALSWLKNLLLPLNTNYATFSFTETVLIINILSFYSKEVSTYYYKRSPGMTPAEGLKDICKTLNKEWYEKSLESRSRRAASEHLLEIGVKDFIPRSNIVPISVNSNSAISRQLTHFNLNLKDLDAYPFEKIKNAFRKKAKKHHPDYGGNPDDFIHISDAYNEILTFIKNPTVRTRTGLPGQWSYDGSDRKWSAPL